MKAIRSLTGSLIPESKIAEIMPIDSEGRKSRVFIAGTIGAVGNSIQDIGGHYEDFSETPSEPAARLGWMIVA